VAVAAAYHGQWTLAGRLRQPLEVIDGDVRKWLAAHPNGRAVFLYRQSSELPSDVRLEYTGRFRGGRLAIAAPK
jgi:hypothetical protein